MKIEVFLLPESNKVTIEQIFFLKTHRSKNQFINHFTQNLIHDINKISLLKLVQFIVKFIYFVFIDTAEGIYELYHFT